MRKLAKRLLAVAATLVIVLAIALGAFRLLVAQLPGYQEEIQVWVTDALGLALQFERLDARLGLRGPELTFHNTSVGGAEGQEPFLSARRANVRIDALALITDRRLAVNRLTLEGPRLVLVREEDGTLSLQGAAVNPDSRMAWGSHIPAEVEVAVRDSEVVYRDRAGAASWTFRGVTAVLSRTGDRLVLEARGRPPAAVAGQVELSAEARFAPGTADAERWSVTGSVYGVDLRLLGRLLPDVQPWPAAGTGDVSLMLGWSEHRLAEAELDVALDGVLIPGRDGDGRAPIAYERLGASAAWRRGADGWSLSLDDVAVTRGGRPWPTRGQARVTAVIGERGDLGALSLRSDFLRMQDLTPALAFVPAHLLEDLGAWAALGPQGDVANLELDIERGREGWDYAVAAELSRVGANPVGEWPGFSGLSGELRADTRSGRARIDAANAQLEWPQLFRATIEATHLSGVLVWRQGRDGFRLVSDDLVLGNADGRARSSLELFWPRDGSSPRLDLESSVSAMNVVAVKRYLPVHRMPDNAVEWLDRALVGGRILGAEVALYGPLRAFPFEADEGQFQAVVAFENGSLDYMEGWPRAEELTGRVTFRNAAFEARGDGRLLGNRGRDVRAAITNMREPVLTLDGRSEGPLEEVLAFLDGAPLIAEHLGAELRRLKAEAGTAAVGVELELPLRDVAAYRLGGAVDVRGGELALEGFAQRVSGIDGRLTFDKASVIGEELRGVLLGGPVTARVEIPGPSGYSAQLDLDGELTAHALVDAFHLPLGDRVAGSTRWRGSVFVPRSAAQQQPLRVNVASSLFGIALGFPAPFAKSPTDATSLRLDVGYVEGRELELRGALGPLRRFALDFRDAGAGLGFSRGALQFGGADARLPAGEGLTIHGELPALRLDDWIDVARASALDPSSLTALLLDADIDVGELSVMRQELGQSRLLVGPGPTEWRIDIDSEPVSGIVSIPRDMGSRGHLRARMQRLRLAGGGAERDLGALDPRLLPGLSLDVDDFSIGMRRFGRVRAEIEAEPEGLRLSSLATEGQSFAIEGTGSWVDGPGGAETRMAFDLRSDDVGSSLAELGFARFAEGQSAEIAAEVSWPGPPSSEWSRHVRGRAALSVATGSLLELEPGAGRVMGLMSITALPRRLALDFRDVFNRGLVFDEISGDFTIADGNAFTDNLKLTGPVVEIGVAGRTGLRDRDYGQQAVVTAEPGKMLPTVGGLLGGPGVGAALLIFTQIFKEPLKGIGRASYCVTGSWDEPAVERLSAEQLQSGRLCAELPVEGLSVAER